MSDSGADAEHTAEFSEDPNEQQESAEFEDSLEDEHDPHEYENEDVNEDPFNQQPPVDDADQQGNPELDQLQNEHNQQQYEQLDEDPNSYEDSDAQREGEEFEPMDQTNTEDYYENEEDEIELPESGVGRSKYRLELAQEMQNQLSQFDEEEENQSHAHSARAHFDPSQTETDDFGSLPEEPEQALDDQQIQHDDDQHEASPNQTRIYYEDTEDDQNLSSNIIVDEDSESVAVRTAEDVAAAKSERDYLIEQNKIKQRLVAAILEKEKQSKLKSSSLTDSSLTGQPIHLANSLLTSVEQSRADYTAMLDKLSVLWQNLESAREEAEMKIDVLTEKLDSEDSKATELAATFKQFKREIAKEAKNSRTNKNIKLKRILAFEAEEERKDKIIAEQRLKHINMINELRDMESVIREREKLAEGLHLIDFEQLKIENQTLNEKIEERNDELHKLRKKTTQTVQVLTHIKEKLTHIQNENEVLFSQLHSIHSAVNGARDELNGLKKARDEVRRENVELKQKQGFIGSDLLVNDYEKREHTIFC